jgi:hypothetical protein
MTVETLVLSDVITNAVATPKVNSNPENNGKLRRIEAKTTSTGTSTTSGSTYLVVRLMSNDVVKGIRIQELAAMDFADFDVGVRQVASPNTLVDGAFATALDMNDGGDLVALGADGDQDTTKKLWEWAGLTSDPGGEFDIHVSLDADATTAGTFKTVVDYIRD